MALCRHLSGLVSNTSSMRRKRIESSSDTRKKLTSVSFSSNNCGLPRPVRSLSRSASSSVEVVVSDFGFLVGAVGICCQQMQRLTLCSPLLVFDVLGYSCLCQSLCRWNCLSLLYQNSSLIEIAIPLSPHLETVKRRSSAHQKHYAQRQCPSLLNGEMASFNSWKIFS